MADDEDKTGFLGELSTATKVLGAIVALVSSYSAISVNRLNHQISQLTEERRFAAQIMERFDQVVSAKDTATEVRTARLAGLVNLANLVSPDPPELRKGILETITKQAAAYQNTLQTSLSTATTTSEQAIVNNQIDQLDAIEQAAKDGLEALAKESEAEPLLAIPKTSVTQAVAAQPPQTGAFAGYRFDIFWCAGRNNSDAAEDLAQEILLLRTADPNASGQWRIRPLDPVTNRRPGYQVDGYTIRVSAVDEQAPARQLATLAKTRLGGPEFRVKRAGSRTPDYISVFVCPSEPAGRKLASAR